MGLGLQHQGESQSLQPPRLRARAPRAPASVATVAARLQGEGAVKHRAGAKLPTPRPEVPRPALTPCVHSPSPAAASGVLRDAARGPQQQQQAQDTISGAPGSPGSVGLCWPLGCGGRAARVGGLRSGRLERMCSIEKGQGRPGPLRLAAPPATAMPGPACRPAWPKYIRRGGARGNPQAGRQVHAG